MKQHPQYQQLPTSASFQRSTDKPLQSPLRRLGVLLLSLFAVYCIGRIFIASPVRASFGSMKEGMNYTFEPVQGFFAQSDPATSPDNYDVVGRLDFELTFRRDC